MLCSASGQAGFPIISDKSLTIAEAFGVSESFVLDILMLATQAKRLSGMMTRATFLLNKERKICYSAVFSR